MINPTRLAALLRSPLSHVILAAVCLIGVLAALGPGGLAARPLRTDGPAEPTAVVAQAPTVAPATATPAAGDSPIADPQPASAPAGGSTAGIQPTATPPAPGSAPVPRPAADLAATPPPPNASQPSWAVNTRETGLWSAPTEGTLFTQVPSGATFRVLDRQANRFRVFYPGDGAKRAAGEAWVDIPDMQTVPWPRWVRLRDAASIMTLPKTDSAPIVGLKRGSYLEVLGEERSNWARVHYIGEGREAPVVGWLDVGPTLAAPKAEGISAFSMTYDQLAAGGPEVWLKVPYRSQIDGSAYAEANCGPTTINMVLEGFGIRVPQPTLRKEVLSLQPDEDCDDCGVYIENLAEVVSRRGLRVRGLRDIPDDPKNFHAWTLDEVRNELRAGRPVVVQVFYRGLPPRASSGYWGDHFIVLTGFAGDRFVYNDPIDSEGPGYSRVISAQALDFAMAKSDYPYAGFSVGR